MDEHDSQTVFDSQAEDTPEPVREPTFREKFSILVVAGIAYLLLIGMCLIVLGIYLVKR